MSLESLRSTSWWGGIALAVAVAIAAGYAAEFLGVTLLGFNKSPISGIMMAIIIGMVIANSVALSDGVVDGLHFCTSTVLRVGIMLLGIRLSLVSAGTNALIALPFVIVAITVGLSTVGLLGRHIGMRPQLAGLIAVGTSICGATAIVATAPFIRAKETEVSYAIACITVFGIVAMFTYPILGHYLFPEHPALAGLFLGTSIHETAQVAGAGMMYQVQYDAPMALDIATVTKLVRNLCMIAVIPLVGVLFGDGASSDLPRRKRWLHMVPWFIVGFAAMSALRTLGDWGDRPFGLLDPAQWEAIVGFLRITAERCLLIAMAAVGLTSMFASMRKLGPRPFFLGLFAALVVGGVSVLLLTLFGDVVAGALGG